MTFIDRTCANNTRMPAGAVERLSAFSQWTETVPPGKILTDDGQFTEDFMGYVRRTGLSLDWFWLGDERSLVMQAHYAAKGGRA